MPKKTTVLTAKQVRAMMLKSANAAAKRDQEMKRLGLLPTVRHRYR